MDENGAVKFPADKAEIVLENSQKMLQGETEYLARLRNVSSAAEIRALQGGTYTEKKK